MSTTSASPRAGSPVSSSASSRKKRKSSSSSSSARGSVVYGEPVMTSATATKLQKMLSQSHVGPQGRFKISRAVHKPYRRVAGAGQRKKRTKSDQGLRADETEEGDDEEAADEDADGALESDEDWDPFSTEIDSDDEDLFGPSTNYSSVKEVFEMEQPVDMMQMYEVRRFAQGNDTVHAAVELVTTALRFAKLSVSLELFGDNIELSPDLQEVFDREWSGGFLSDLVWNLSLYGFAVCNLVPSEIKRDELVPMVISPSCYMLTFLNTFDNRREYRVYPLDPPVRKMNLRDKTVRDQNPNLMLPRQRRVQVFVLHPPDDEGSLTSPLSKVLKKLRTLDWAIDAFGRTAHLLANPVWNIESNPSSKESRVSPLVSAPAPENDLLIDDKKQYALVDQYEREEVQQTIATLSTHYKSTAEQQERLQAQVGADAGRLPANPHSKQPPFLNFFTPGSSRHVSLGPQAVPHPQLIEFWSRAEAAVASVMGIPAQFLGSEQVVHAANAELNMRLFDRSIRALQKILLPFIQALFDRAYRYAHRDFKGEKFKELRTALQNEMRENLMSSKSTADAGGGNLGAGGPGAEFIRGTGQPTPGGGHHAELPSESSDGPVTTGQAIKLSIAMGRTVRLGTDGRAEQPKSSALRRPYRIDSNVLTQLVENNIKFKLGFTRTPLTDAASIDMLYQKAIINYKTWSRDMAEVVGVSPESVNTEKEHMEQMRETAKQQDTINTEFPANAAPAKPAAPGAKPASSGGSASKQTVAKPATAAKK